MAKSNVMKKPEDEPVIAPVVEMKHSREMLQAASLKRNEWYVKAMPHATQDDVRTPGYWTLIAPQISRHDVVHVLADDESWEIELRVESSSPVLGCEMSVAKVMARKGVSDAVEILGDGQYRLLFKAGAGYCVERISDGAAVLSGLVSADAARIRWAREQPRVPVS